MLTTTSALILIALLYVVLGESTCTWDEDTKTVMYKYTGRGLNKGTDMEISYAFSKKDTKEDNK